MPMPKMVIIDLFIMPPMPRTAKKLWKKYPRTHEFENNYNDTFILLYAAPINCFRI